MLPSYGAALHWLFAAVHACATTRMDMGQTSPGHTTSTKCCCICPTDAVTEHSSMQLGSWWILFCRVPCSC